MTDQKTLYFRDRKEWRQWLDRHHTDVKGAWLRFYKKNTGKPGLKQQEAVEEAICYGWIDSKVKRIDDEIFIQRFTPRHPDSVWSRINRERAERLIAEGRMTAAGLILINAARSNGSWEAAYSSQETMVLPEDLAQALHQNRHAWENFQKFAPTYQNMYISWVISAKRITTREGRIKQVVRLASVNQKTIAT